MSAAPDSPPKKRNALAAAMALRVGGRASFPTLEQIKAALGIEADDDSKDEAITAGLAATIAMIESYLGRGIAYAAEVQQFEPIDTRNPKLSLWRFPVEAVTSVTSEGTELGGWRVYSMQGVLQWAGGCCPRRGSGCEAGPIVVVTYTGGYPDDAWPADLLEAVMRAFYGRWNASGGEIATTQPGGAVRSWAADGLTVQYSEASAQLGAGLAEQTIPPDLVGVAAQLDPYRVRYASGV